MKTIKVSSKLTAAEKETCLNYDYIDKKWVMCSFISTHYNRALKQCWTPITQYIYEDGTVCGMVLTAPANAITIRNPSKKRIMSDKQMNNLRGNYDEDEDE